MRAMRFAIALALGVLLSSTVEAAFISNSQYSLTQIGGTWAYGSTGWNLGTPVNNAADLVSVGQLLSNGYTDNFDQRTVNGIYMFPGPNGQLTFSFNGGAQYLLDTLSFISSRAYGTSPIVLEYKLGAGPWQIAESTTTSALGMYPALSNNLNPGQSFSLSFGSVLADSFRITISGSQVSLHEISVFGVEAPSATTPEPTSLALAGFAGIGMAVGAWRRRRQQAA